MLRSRDHLSSSQKTWRGRCGVNLESVETRAMRTAAEYADFDDYWDSNTAPIGPQGKNSCRHVAGQQKRNESALASSVVAGQVSNFEHKFHRIEAFRPHGRESRSSTREDRRFPKALCKPSAPSRPIIEVSTALPSRPTTVSEMRPLCGK
jgi:hypothetical protein